MAIAFVTSIAMASSAFAQTDCTKTVPPSPFGKDDQTGATNRITPAVTKAAAAEIKDGTVISLTNPLVDGVPLFGSRFTKSVLTAVIVRGAAFGKNDPIEKGGQCHCLQSRLVRSVDQGRNRRDEGVAKLGAAGATDNRFQPRGSQRCKRHHQYARRRPIGRHAGTATRVEGTTEVTIGVHPEDDV